MKLKKILWTILLIVVILVICFVFYISGKRENKNINNEKLNIVVTNFSTYDFVRQIAKDNVNLTFLLGPGIDEHSYEPTAADLIKIQEADLFIYIGGNMEEWATRVIHSLNIEKNKIMCISDYIEKKDEIEIDGAEDNEHNIENETNVYNKTNAYNEYGSGIKHESNNYLHTEGSFEEHIWTSTKNAIKMIETIKEKIIQLDSENKEKYEENADKYILEINNLEEKIQKIVDNKVRDRLVFGDKMPMQYFIEQFGLKVTAAFSGCSSDSEPSSATIAYLISKVKEENIPVILYIELNNGRVAKIIADETGTETMQIQSLHNVSKDDFKNGETYVSLMTRNLEVLKKALQ